METGLIRTDKPMYKIKRFFMRLFGKANYDTPVEIETQEIEKEEVELNLDKVILNKTETQEEEVKEGLAKKIIAKEMELNLLSNEELNEMIEFFQDKYTKQKTELISTKNQLGELKSELSRRNEENKE